MLQGGGALGAYQAGVFEGLDRSRHRCDWAAGISIGAINAALIAGNEPARRVERLREFWNTVTAPPLLPATSPWWAHAVEQGGEAARTALGWFEASRAMLEGQRGFFVPRVPSPAFACRPRRPNSSLYDTAPLAATLERLVDFDRINHNSGLRLTVSAVNIASGNFELVRQPARRLGRPHHGRAHRRLGRAAAGLCGRGDRGPALLGRRPGVEHAAVGRARRRAAARHAGVSGRSVERARPAAEEPARRRRARQGHPLFEPHARRDAAARARAPPAPPAARSAGARAGRPAQRRRVVRAKRRRRHRTRCSTSSI